MGSKQCCFISQEKGEFNSQIYNHQAKNQNPKQKSKFLRLQTYEEAVIEDLTFAAITNDLLNVKIILETKNIPVDSPLQLQPPNRTLLHVAADYCYQDLLDFLLKHYRKKMNINAQDNMGWTALMCAVWVQNYEGVIKLMQYGSDPSIANGDSQTAEDIAREKRLTYLAEFLASNSKQKSYEAEISEQISVIEEESGENTGNTEENQNSSKLDYENSSHQNVSKISENQNRPSNKSGSESKQINYTEENSSQSQLSKKDLSFKNSLTEQEDTAKSCNFQPEIDEVSQVNETHCQKTEIMKNDLSCKATILRNVTNFPIRKQESEETGVGNVCSSEDDGFYDQDDQDYHLQFVEV